MSFADFTSDGGPPLAVLSLRLSLPIRGAWWAEIELDATSGEAPAVYAPARLTMGGRSWSGYVFRAQEWHGRTRVFFEAGTGGMRLSLDDQQYESALVSTVAEGIAAEVSETIDSTAASPTDVLQYYRRGAGRAGVLLSSVLSTLGLTWRFTDAGRLWWGVDTWPAASETGVEEIEPWGEAAETEVRPLTPTLSPGTTFGGRRIERVTYTLSEDEPLTARLSFVRDGGGELRGALGRAVRAVLPELPYLPRYPATVVRQTEDGRVELAPDDGPAVAGSPHVPALYGLPGVRCEVSAGARVGLVHEAGDARRPRAMGWESATPVDTIRIDVATLLQLAGGEAAVHRVGDGGSGGSYSLGPGGLTLIYSDPEGTPLWSLSGAAGATPVVFVLAPLGDPTKLGQVITKALNGAEKVKA